MTNSNPTTELKEQKEEQDEMGEERGKWKLVRGWKGCAIGSLPTGEYPPKLDFL